MEIKAIIFDMDGVLIEAKEWHYEALNRALNLFGMEISRYEHLTIFDGLPTKNKLKILSLEQNLPESLHSFINKMKQQYTMDIVHTSCKPRFIHEYALSKLKNEGYKLACCSNSIKHTIEVMLKKAALLEYLDFFLSNEDVSKAKPDPEIYIKAIQKLGFHPKEVMVVEDNFNGIKAARESGANVMEVDSVEEVNFLNIKKTLEKFQKEAQ
ncbi:HAD family hydrolase [Helicobacter turcicus]|uniref:HAD family phosphatase n=1 Tax=Helicobacter turcicus TaxID=2867412 RepID=A0ABS7JN94_9HELI|nr:HAD family phosphatase [Helicobacter turcicus]MBX7490845.1 HAD family phosphatase [Helicobacter turcicus]MBX7545700.1 HAD family phosphatase [Helicobacter turcicus]